MNVVVPAEAAPGEARVALTPESARRLLDAGLSVAVEAGAGQWARVTDDAYRAAGVDVVPLLDPDVSDVVLHVRPLPTTTIARLRPGTVTVGLWEPPVAAEVVAALTERRVTAFALELVPRLSRAQAMDALTSQAMVAGYRAVLEAANRLPRFFPLVMTAAGTVPPARVLVLGTGVAGLQAIMTARRLGAEVTAYDVRPSSADEVRSTGAAFLDLGLEPIEGPGGYARELTPERAARQQELLAPHVAAADVLITTAAVPGRPAPVLVTAAMVAAMRSGSVVVDLAAESGGNVEGAAPGSERLVGAGVTVLGVRNPTAALAEDASRLYAANVAALLLLMTKDGQVVPDLTDEVLAGGCLTQDGVVRHRPTAERMEAGV